MSRQTRRAHQRQVAKKLVNVTTTSAYLKKMEGLGLLRRKRWYEKLTDKIKNAFSFGQQRA